MKQNLYLQVLFCSFNKVVVALNELFLRLIWRWCWSCSWMVSCFVYLLSCAHFLCCVHNTFCWGAFLCHHCCAVAWPGICLVQTFLLVQLVLLRPGFYITYLFATRVHLDVPRSYWFSLSYRGNNSWCYSVRKNHRVMKQRACDSL